MTQRTLTNGVGVEIKYRTQIIMGNVGRASLTHRIHKIMSNSGAGEIKTETRKV